MLKRTGHMDSFQGIPVFIPNDVITPEDKKKDFYVSYNSHDSNIYGSDTTALVWGQMQNFFILNGDHTEEYSKLINQGWDACFAYFEAHIDQINKYSKRRNPKEE